MDRLVKIALRIITALILVATVVSFSESYHGLFEWAVSHQVPWFWALVWPLMLDLVILVGECTVFVAIHKHWKLRHRAWAWAVTYTGLAVSTLANGGHVASTDRLTHLTNALPPVALMFALTVGLGVLKRTRMMPSESLSPPLTEKPSQPLTQFVRTSPERSHVGSQPWIENGLPGLSRTPAETLTQPESPLTETLSPPIAGTPETLTESLAVALPESLNPTETFATPDFKVIPGKSFTLPQDTRQGLKMAEVRVRDMLDVDPDISANAISKALGCAWATADKYLNATKEARGLEVS